MYYIKLRYIFEDIYHELYDYFLKLFHFKLSDHTAKYRISFVEREKESHKLIKERVMEDDIIDIDTLSQRYILILKAFGKNKSSEIPKNPNNNFYVEISEVRKKIKKIAFACVL